MEDVAVTESAGRGRLVSLEEGSAWWDVSYRLRVEQDLLSTVVGGLPVFGRARTEGSVTTRGVRRLPQGLFDLTIESGQRLRVQHIAGNWLVLR